MSAVIIPALALGGVYFLYRGMTKKNKDKHNHHSSYSSSSSSSSSTRKHRSSSSNKKDKSKKSIFSSLLKLGKNKTKKEKEDRKEKKEKSKTLYVYYTYGSNKNKKWHYKNLPGGWNLKNKSDITTSKTKYTKLNTFTGPKKNKEAIRRYLEKAFEYLKNKNIVKYYKITSEKVV